MKINIAVVGRFHAFNLAKELQEKNVLNKLITTYPKTVVSNWQIKKELVKDEIFLEMQKNRTHMALVIDEYGGFSGIITIEDLVEEIVGDISDEDDEYEVDEPIFRISENTYKVDGLTSISDVNELLEIELPTDVNDTIGGLLLGTLGKIPNLEEENEEKIADINKMLYCKDYNDKTFQKLILGDLDNDDFKRILKNNYAEIQNKNLLNAFNNFSIWIDKKTEDYGIIWLNKFFYKLVNVAKIIRLDVSHAQDAYKLFETINNRGLKLSATDIIKNFILGHAAKISESKLDEVKTIWSDIIISLDGLNTDDFFRQYITGLYQRKITHTKLVEEFKNYYFKNVDKVELLGVFKYIEIQNDSLEEDEEDITEEFAIIEETEENKSQHKKVDITVFLQQILNASKTYKKIIFCNDADNQINKLLRDLTLIKSFPSYIFLMFYMQQNKTTTEKKEILNYIAALMLRRHTCEKRTSENDDIFAKLLKIDFNEDSYVELIKKELLKFYPDDDEFLDKFPIQELKGKNIDRAKYMLTEIEYYKTGNTYEFTINSGNLVHLEHIVPEVITTKKSKLDYGDWETYLGNNSVAKHKRYVNYIGNMTLLSGTYNISISNNPFVKKSKTYKNSNISITKDLYNNYGVFKFPQIEKRGQEFGEIAIKIWKI